MAKSEDGNIQFQNSQHSNIDTVSTPPSQILQKNESTVKESGTQANLDSIWRGLSETPKLMTALSIFGDPLVFEPSFKAAALAYREAMGYLPNTQWATIATLDQASDSLDALVANNVGPSLSLSIACRHQAVLLSDEIDVQLPVRLHKLGLSLLMKARIGKAVPDVDHAIACAARAVQLYQVADKHRVDIFDTLGMAYVARFSLCKELRDIDSAIEHQKQAASLIGSPYETDRPIYLNLGRSYALRFEQSGALGDIDEAIKHQAYGLSSMPEDHPNKSNMFEALGILHRDRFTLLGSLEDIHAAIRVTFQAVSLTPNRCTSRAARLSNLGILHQRRFERLGQPADIDRAIACHSEAVTLTPDGHSFKSRRLNNIGTSYQARFILLGKLADIDMAIEHQSKAVSLISDRHAEEPLVLNNLGNSHQLRFEHLGKLEDIDQAIAYQSQVMLLISDQHSSRPTGHNNLGNSYMRRFERFGELADVDRAIAHQSEAVLLTPNGHSEKHRRLSSLGSSHLRRFENLGELTDINQAVTCHAQAVSLTPDGHASKPGWLGNLGNSYQCRFECLGELEDIDRAIACQSKAASLIPDEHSGKTLMLNSLSVSLQCRFKHLGELADINRAIELQAAAVSVTPDEHTHKPGRLSNLGVSHQYRFECHEDRVDIDQAIKYHSKAVLLTPDGHADKPEFFNNLGDSYQCRFKHTGGLLDIEKAMSFLQMAALSSSGKSTTRFSAAKKWAQAASLINHPTVLSAYRRAIDLIPQIIWIGSTVNSRYDNMRTIGALEAGRSIVWNQTLRLRTQFDDLSDSAPDLAKNLKQVAQELESVGQRDTSVSANNSQSLELTAQRHRRLAEDYEKMLTEARQLPGFHDFMRPKKAAELMLAAKHGPVIIVNVHSDRCDALILRPQSEDVAHVPLPNISYEDIGKLQQQTKGWILSKGKRHQRPVVSGNRAPKQPQGIFAKILSELWHKIVKPILDFLGYIKFAPEELLPHVTWCTTGALSFLPIHAAGCYDPAGPEIFDYVVSSYAPSLGALISAASSSLEVGSILAVSQEDDSLRNTNRELACIQRHVKGFPYVQLTKGQATPEAVVDAMVKYNSVHLACHGKQNTERAAKSCPLLHGGTLTLEEINKRSLKNKGLAFLSACQTATGDEQMPDESVHLAAGMLVAGYPAVIATMWSIDDADAPKVADLVYENLLRDRKLGDGRVARAPHTAVKELREEIGEDRFDRWIPYIHIGA